MADALAAAHAAGILHRDLKPANVMIAENGQVKLLDFGLAKLTSPSEITELDETRTIQTQDGSIVGTIAYMSPEQAEGKKLDFRSNIFSFGAVLYEMVTGQRAFTGDSTASTLSNILRDEPKPVVSVRPDVPRDLEKLIARCLRKDPSRRVQTAGDLRAALEDLKEDLDSGKLEHATTPVPRHRFPWRIVVAAIFLVAAVAGYLRFRAPEPEAALTAVPLTGNPGLESNASVFAGRQSGSVRLERRKAGQLRHLRKADRWRSAPAPDHQSSPGFLASMVARRPHHRFRSSARRPYADNVGSGSWGARASVGGDQTTWPRPYPVLVLVAR
jgi:serine/threonine protein kinase